MKKKENSVIHDCRMSFSIFIVSGSHTIYEKKIIIFKLALV
jgi:hypothetical protein